MKNNPFFGEHIREGIAIIKDWIRNPDFWDLNPRNPKVRGDKMCEHQWLVVRKTWSGIVNIPTAMGSRNEVGQFSKEILYCPKCNETKDPWKETK
jgi:hypothetical protein